MMLPRLLPRSPEPAAPVLREARRVLLGAARPSYVSLEVL